MRYLPVYDSNDPWILIPSRTNYSNTKLGNCRPPAGIRAHQLYRHCWGIACLVDKFWY